ncbi:hypothetical protein EWM64_g9507 [Hericium alpestre]|uniref:Uncharacterized protein n=1 Tax=Hericium alpestre TaxID=135208 RepID=A0A4Y9ZIM6_9AGAM|nr:hypothetical protein EWM64_g9507 [Hericium alpestre]
MTPRVAGYPVLWKRLSSTSTFTAKSVPLKAHHHKPIPDEVFPKGYVVSGTHCGVKKNPNALDLGIILSTSPRPTSAAACFTRNAFKAAPVLVSQDVLQQGAGRARALVVNSGCANAVTGKQGLEDAWVMVHATDALLSPAPTRHDTLVMSTGVIGQTLPIAKIVAGIEASTALGAGFSAWERAARAFMTTDTFPKLRARTFSIGGREFRMAGVAGSDGGGGGGKAVARPLLMKAETMSLIAHTSTGRSRTLARQCGQVFFLYRAGGAWPSAGSEVNQRTRQS